MISQGIEESLCLSPGVSFFIVMLRGVASPSVSDLSSDTDTEMDTNTVNVVKTMDLRKETPGLKLSSLCSFRIIRGVVLIDMVFWMPIGKRRARLDTNKEKFIDQSNNLIKQNLRILHFLTLANFVLIQHCKNSMLQC